MFDLEQSIMDWRKQMLAAGINAPVPMEELEIHLREEIERQIKIGASEQQAFEIAVMQIGQTRPLKMEFKKIDAEKYNRPLTWSAWILFMTSLFLPALGDGLGWRCAGLSATAVSWPDFSLRNWFDVHLASLTLANLLMIASPFLLARLSSNPRFKKWWFVFNFLALILVWSFLVILLVGGNGGDLKIGCYVWAVSFLLLFLSTLKIRRVKMPAIAN